MMSLLILHEKFLYKYTGFFLFIICSKLLLTVGWWYCKIIFEPCCFTQLLSPSNSTWKSQCINSISHRLTASIINTPWAHRTPKMNITYHFQHEFSKLFEQWIYCAPESLKFAKSVTWPYISTKTFMIAVWSKTMRLDLWNQWKHRILEVSNHLRSQTVISVRLLMIAWRNTLFKWLNWETPVNDPLVHDVELKYKFSWRSCGRFCLFNI